MELSPAPSPAGRSGSLGATVEEDAATAELSVVVVAAGAAGAAGAGVLGAGAAGVVAAAADLVSQGLGLGGSDDMNTRGRGREGAESAGLCVACSVVCVRAERA